MSKEFRELINNKKKNTHGFNIVKQTAEGANDDDVLAQLGVVKQNGKPTKPTVDDSSNPQTPVDQLNETINAKDDQIQQFSADIKQKTREIDDLKVQKNQLTTKLTNIKQDLEAATSQNSETNNKVGDLVAEIDKLKQEIDDKTKALETATAQYKEHKAAWDNEKSDLTKRLETLEQYTGINQKSKGAATTEKVALEVLGEGSAQSRRYEKLISQGQQFVSNYMRQRIVYQYNPQAEAYWRQNRKQVSEGVEAVLKEHGMFGGGDVTQASKLTTISDIPSLAFDHLSTFVRSTNFPDLIWWYFASEVVNPGSAAPSSMNNPVYNFSFERWKPRKAPRSKAERILTPVKKISSDTYNLGAESKSMQMLEIGLGNGIVDDANPIGFTEFVNSFSLMDLEAMISEQLALDYQATKDIFLQEEIFRTNIQLYNDGNNIVSTPGAVNTVGTLNRQFLSKVQTYMKNRGNVPSIREDGHYYLVTTPTGVEQLFADLDEKVRYINADYIDNVSRILTGNRSTYEGGEIIKYKGSVMGFHVFEQNKFGLGDPTNTEDPGTFTETLGVGARTTLQSFVFGIEAIGWGVSMPAQVRFEVDNDYGRQQKLIWKAHANSVSLDVIDNPNPLIEEARVFGLRTTVQSVG